MSQDILADLNHEVFETSANVHNSVSSVDDAVLERRLGGPRTIYNPPETDRIRYDTISQRAVNE